jgi:ubiquinone/menaquinone biosynthesis C-methylase UbiE
MTPGISAGTGNRAPRRTGAADEQTGRGSLRGIDLLESFVAQAQRRVATPEVVFETGDATHLPWKPHAWDATVSGLVLNFVPDPEVMAREMVRVIAVSPNSARLDQAERFPLCRPQPLQALFERVGFRSIASDALAWAVQGVA